MSPSEFIGYGLNTATGVTALTSTRIYHGTRPNDSVTPAINYYQVGGGRRQYGCEVVTFSVNCRASDPETARDLARAVIDRFHGTSGTGIYGTLSSGTAFDVARSGLRADQGLVPEPTDELYNAPVDIQIAYVTSTVS